jgi:hypothetical protein
MVGPAYQVPASPSQEDSPGPVRSAAAAGLGGYAAVAETHSAVVFFVGDRAYKLKKPVALGFLDFTRPRARAAACRREMTLNRRFAPDVYLGVAAVHGPDGPVCDHLVVMRRMPAARRLSALVRAGADVERPVRQVARVLAAWHATAPRSRRIAAQGTPEAHWRRWEASIGQVRSYSVGPRLRLCKKLTGGPASSSRAGQRCSRNGSAAAIWWMATVTCSPTTSSASMMACASWTAWSSTTACAGSMGWMTPRSWRWVRLFERYLFLG